MRHAWPLTDSLSHGLVISRPDCLHLIGDVWLGGAWVSEWSPRTFGLDGPGYRFDLGRRRVARHRSGDRAIVRPLAAALLECHGRAVFPHTVDGCTAGMMRKPNRARVTSDPPLLLLYGVGLLVRHARARGGCLLLTGWPSGKRIKSSLL